jgi:hypothetical protein
MDKKKKTSYYTLMTIGLLGMLASVYNVFSGVEKDWYMTLITFICSLSLVYGAQQLKTDSFPDPED